MCVVALVNICYLGPYSCILKQKRFIIQSSQKTPICLKFINGYEYWKLVDIRVIFKPISGFSL